MQVLLEDSRMIEYCMNPIRCMVHVAHLIVHIKANVDVTSWNVEEKKVCNAGVISFTGCGLLSKLLPPLNVPLYNGNFVGGKVTGKYE